MAKLDTQNSIVDYLKSQGQDSSMTARKQLAKELGITNYSGSGPQNTQMLNALKSGNTSKSNDAKITPSNPAADVPIANASNKSDDGGIKSNLKGVDDETYGRMNSTFEASKDVGKADKKSNNALSNLEGLVSKENIISSDVMSALGSSFSVPSEVREADAWLSAQLQKIQSGKTSYSDQVKEMMDKIMNREKFSYDVDTDPLFQQALASAMNSGKIAMQDTIGQASALTGGYGSTYATTAGNQAYNSFIEDAYDNLPQYYQLALEAYQMEGDEMFRQYGMLSAEDDKEFNRNVTAYDATYQHRNRVYDESYNMFRDNKNDAFAMANLQLNEHGQRVSDAYNYYNATSDYADKLYEREYTKWADDVNLAYKYAEMLNSDYWSETSFDYQKERDTITDSHWEQEFAETKRVNDAQIAKLKSSGSGGSGSGGGGKTSNLTDSQLKTAQKLFVEAGGGDVGLEKVDGYLSTIGKNNLSEEATSYLLDSLNGADIPVYYQDWTISDDTYNGGFLGTPLWAGDDHNDVYTNGSTTMTFKELKKAIENSDLEESEKKKRIDALRKQSKN